MLVYRKVKGVLSAPDGEVADYTIHLPTLPTPAADLVYKRIRFSVNNVLTIYEGYPWDFASWAFDTRSIIEGSLVHDPLCELMKNGLLSEDCWDECAEIMYNININHEPRMFKWRARYVRRAIKIAGPGVMTKRKYIRLRGIT